MYNLIFRDCILEFNDTASERVYRFTLYVILFENTKAKFNKIGFELKSLSKIYRKINLWKFKPDVVD